MLDSQNAALGVAQIRKAVANSNTLRLSRATVVPTGAICYELHLRNSHGVGYARTAVMDGAVLSILGTEGFTALWNLFCAHQRGDRDITAELEDAIRKATR